MTTETAVIDVLRHTLDLGERAESFVPQTVLLGNLPELDSVAVLNVIVALEERFGITVHDDEVSAETFASVETLVAFVDARLPR